MSALPGAALFDLDGTLMDREPLMLEAVRRVLDASGAELDHDRLALTVGRAWPDVHAELVTRHGVTEHFDPFMDAVFAAADALVAGGFPTRVLAGGRQLMERLHALEVPLAVVTGSLRREMPAALEIIGVNHLVSLVLAAEDYAPGKPDPAGYLLAAERLGVDPRRCVVFEDSEAGVAAGVAAGMRVIATSDANPPAGHPAHQDLSAAHLVVPTLSVVSQRDLQVPPA